MPSLTADSRRAGIVYLVKGARPLAAHQRSARDPGLNFFPGCQWCKCTPLLFFSRHQCAPMFFPPSSQNASDGRPKPPQKTVGSGRGQRPTTRVRACSVCRRTTSPTRRPVASTSRRHARLHHETALVQRFVPCQRHQANGVPTAPPCWVFFVSCSTVSR